MEADEARLKATMDKLRDMGIGMVGFNHCTGDAAQERMRAEEEGGTVYTHLKTGDCIFL